MDKRKRLTRNLGRVEFIENKEFIEMMIKKGYPLKYIYEVLAEEGKFTMAYTTFIAICRKIKRGELKLGE
ncbi:TraK family protein [Desulfomicrobium orale]|uniref:Uncharacterized protein n=1 Tax=Desulfomicrobium orale DSM 12838 TaxID=888061 RepID=A0A0X8JR52_9BACT|nr:TraK family protein [Desulfomicrobium orale]AMD93399.1 hypothetical protein AXF15_10020 [Desulfomicrobium orale DSM 12838]